MKRKDFINLIKTWTPLALVITAFCGLSYITVQQNYRMSANDPQIELAQDVSRQLSEGQNFQYFIPQRKIDMAKTLASYILIFDGNGKIIGSSITLNGQNPVVPQGVFAQTKRQGETRFTWQPQQGVRSALVMDYYSNPKTSGFVAVGRSLKEIEIREDNLEKMVALAWIFTLASSLILVYFLQKLK